MKTFTTRVVHKLTAYHWRYDRDQSYNKLGICSCGWKAKFMRDSPKDYLRKSKCIFGHKWGEPEPMEIGELFKKDDGTWTSTLDEGDGGIIVGYMKQCDRCFRCNIRDV